MAYCIMNFKTVASVASMRQIQAERLREKDFSNVDKERSHLNRALTEEQDCIQIYNEAKKCDYYTKKDSKGRTHSEPKVKALNVVLTYSPEAHLERDPAVLKSWEEENIKFLQSAFPGCPLVATTHMDESTPHIHAVIIPQTKSGKISKNQFISGKAALVKLQDRYAEVMQQFNLERGEHREERNSEENKDTVQNYAAIRDRTEKLQERYDTIKERGDIKFNEVMETIKPLQDECARLEKQCRTLQSYLIKLKEEIDRIMSSYKAIRAVFNDHTIPEAEKLLEQIERPTEPLPLDRDEGYDR